MSCLGCLFSRGGPAARELRVLDAARERAGKQLAAVELMFAQDPRMRGRGAAQARQRLQTVLGVVELALDVAEVAGAPAAPVARARELVDRGEALLDRISKAADAAAEKAAAAQPAAPAAPAAQPAAQPAAPVRA